jgi:hypothetical protein
MKKVIYIFLSIQCILLLHNCSYGQSKSLKSVTIKWVDFNIETFTGVTCDVFDHSFNDGKKKTKFIFNKTDLIQFQLLLEKFKVVKPLKSFDVRGSVDFLYSKVSDKYCFSKFGYFYKDGKYYFNKPLMIFIADKIYMHHPKYLDTLRQYD